MSKFVCAAFVTMCCLLQGLASAQSNKAESDLPYIPNTRIRPFPYLQSSNFEMLDGATVSIEFGYAPGLDQLLLDYRGDYPITAEWKSDGGVLWLTGAAPASVYMTAISSVIFLTQSDNGQPRRITWSFGKNVLFSSLTGHFYQFHTDPVQWTTAQAQCEAPKNKMFGLQGYLATITSANEMASVGGRMSQPQFIGGNDLNSSMMADGDWQWVTGPEANTRFWKGHNQFNGGMAVDNQYSAWARFQPNDGGKPKSSGSTSSEKAVSEDYLALKHGYVPGVGYMMDVAADVKYGYICEFGGMDASAEAMMGSYANTVVLSFSCEMLEDGGDCTAASNYGCVWSGACTQSKCVKYTDEGACVADSKCEWSMTGDIGKCGNTLCGGYSGASACEAGGNCKYVSAGGLNTAAVCRRAMCYDMTTAATCASLPGCQFVNSMCMAQATYGCAKVDTVFLLDGSDAMKGMWGKASNGFQGLVDTLRQLPWSINGDTAGQQLGFVQYGPKRLTTPAEMVGSGALNTLRTTSSDVMGDLAALLASFTSSLPSDDRKISAALTIAADMLKSDSSTNQKRIVIFAAGEISDAAASTLPSGVDVYGYALKPSNQITHDGTDAENSLKQLSGIKATGSISLYDVAATVLAQCQMTNPNPTTTCFSHSTRAACEADTACGYDFSVDACKTSACQANRGETDCNNSPTGCEWLSGACKNKVVTCGNYGDDTSCEASDACYWNVTQSKCVSTGCRDSPTEDSCIDEPRFCVWSSAIMETTASGAVQVKKAGACSEDKCRKYDAKGCTSANGCMMSARNICIQNPCPALQNKVDCEAQGEDSAALGRCFWNPTSGKCVISDCAKHATEMECGVADTCTWDVTSAPGRCKLAKCTGYNQLNQKGGNQALPKQMCDSEPTECKWNGVLSLCESLTCDKIDTSSQCGGRSECVWRDTKCVDVRNVQCPGIDLIVAVEATSMMSKTFGRHPNGFMGVLEQLRAWGQEMKFANDSTTAGFRTQLMLYGSSAAKTFPANNAFFTADGGNGKGWYGAGGELFNARDAYEKGPHPAGDTNLLAGSLSDAVKTFSAKANYPTAASSSRKKVVLVLGHSPVTAEPNVDLDKTLTSLEEQGVEVFSNYIRRFSTLTPAEEAAAQRLMPFTSDPRRTHFSYVTIDTLRPLFLDGFCDPTTQLGQAMKISRNGVLPCQWLSGQTECEVQAGCKYDANAEKTCPVAGQCPSLGCQKLPAGLARLFKCENCELQSGAIKCETGKTLPVAKGLCKVDDCMLNFTTAAACNAKTGVCEYDTAAKACVRQQCQAAVPAGRVASEFCNQDAACVWVDSGLNTPSGLTSSGCVKSTCGLFRDSTTCSEKFLSPGSGGSHYRQCYFNKVVSPAICLTSRCTNSNRNRCNADPTCNYVSNTGGRSCEIAVCRHASQARCEMDKGCYWNPDYKHNASIPMCQARPKSCVLAKAFGPWSACSASCQGGIQFRTREIYAAANGGSSCQSVANAKPIDGISSLVDTRQCGGTTACSAHCDTHKTASPCAADISCYFNASKCHARETSPCSILAKTDCESDSAGEGCAWDSVYSFCFAGVTTCKGDDASRFASSCKNMNGCGWQTGAANNMDAQKLDLTSHLTNPGGEPILLFPTLREESDSVINGATVTIEGNYSRGSDMLSVLSSGNIMSEFRPAAGTLFLWGSASVTEYMNALRGVTFATTSQSTASRLVTWSLGQNVVYSQVTGHYYQVFNHSQDSNDVSYSTAEANCNAQGEMWGKYGYLAAIESEHENSVISNNLEAVGWISGQDTSQKQWRYTTGPMADDKFWLGGPSFAGGRPAPNMWANWATDYPNSSTTMFTNAYLSETGYWTTKTVTQLGRGYICEFGGLSKDTAFATHATHGATVVSGAGCMPTPCKYLATETGCKRDPACIWQAGSCSIGCGGFSSAGQCARATHCKWDDSTVPASCAVDICLNAAKSLCQGALAGSCLWTEATQCQYRTGCAKHTSQDSCGAVMQCVWNDAGTAGVAAYCGTRPCNMFTSQTSCGLNSQCIWNPNSNACVSTVCMTGDESECKADRRCTWQDGLGGLAATFTPGGSPILPFTSRIARPDDVTTSCSGVTVQISQGFQQGMDSLFVRSEDNVQGSFVVSYNRETGTLVARTAPGVINSRFGCYEFLRDAVRFFTTSTAVNTRKLTYTLAADTTSNTNGTKLYQWVNQRAANWTAATNVCAAWATKQGYTGGQLAAISSQVDNLALRAMGAQGWLRATVHKDTNNWHWPPTMSNFWQGAGATGSPVSGQFAQWAGGEPRGATAETSRAFMVSSGFWKVVSPGSNVPKGVICEYDAPAVIVTGFRSATPFGCFKSACLGYDFDVCRQDPQCVWVDSKNGTGTTAGQCAMDTWCTGQRTPDTCVKRELCYWDYGLGTCRTAPSSKCSAKTDSASCGQSTGCEWKGTAEYGMLARSKTQTGVCSFKGCATHPAESPCNADPTCRWATSALTSACVPRLCGYLTEAQCWGDKMCMWDQLVSRCGASKCTQYAPDSASCNSENSCAKATVNNAAICGYVRCGTTMKGTSGKDKCEEDTSCLWNAAAETCGSADCQRHAVESKCNEDSKCYFTYNPNRCLAAQCTSNSDLEECEKGEIETARKPCIWDQTTASCRQPTFEEQNAPAQGGGICQREEYGNLWWLWLLAAVILVLILLIFSRLYIAYKYGISFFEPARNTKTFSPHSGVGEDVFLEAQQYGEETNIQTEQSTAPQYNRPTADEL